MNNQLNPEVSVVVLGYNHADDTVECLQSLQKTDYDNLSIVYVDNGSEEPEFDRVCREVPDVTVLRYRDNVGVGNGFNGGMAYAVETGAEHVVMMNNDTKIDPAAIRLMAENAKSSADIGIVIPKVFFYDHPRTIWSAGSRFRRFPPAIVHKNTSGDDDGRFDSETELEYACFCVALIRSSLIEAAGLLDPAYHVFHEDYDMCARAKAAGYRIVFEPQAHIWHKIPKSKRLGSRSEEYWRIFGRGEALFCRKHHRLPLLTGRMHRAYVLLRILAEGKYSGLAPYVKGFREGMHLELKPEPRWNDESLERPEQVRVF